MKYLQRLRQSTITNQILSVSTTFMMVGTIALAVFGCFQYLTSRNQLLVMRQMIDQNERLIKASSDQANASARSAHVAEDEMQAVKDSAQATKDSASAANTAVEQNKELVKAAQTQANTSQVSATAAEDAAQTARESMRIGQGADVIVNGCTLSPFAPMQDLSAAINFYNEGRLRANGILKVAVMARAYDPPENFQPSYVVETGLSLPYHLPYTYTHNYWRLEDAVIKSITEERRKIYVFGVFEYGDKLTAKQHTRFCFKFGPKNTDSALCRTWNTN